VPEYLKSQIFNIRKISAWHRQAEELDLHIFHIPVQVAIARGQAVTPAPRETFGLLPTQIKTRAKGGIFK
jgi:hypothetical protein